MSSCPRCGHRLPAAPLIVRQAAALILLRTGYSHEQIAEHSTINAAPLDDKALTADLLEAGAVWLRAIGFTYHGVWDTVSRLRAKLGAPVPTTAAAVRAEQLLLDGAQP